MLPILLFAGMSHVNATRLALVKAEREHVTYVNFQQSPELIDKATGKVDFSRFPATKPDIVLLSMAGNAHNIVGMFDHPQPYAMGHPTKGRVPVEADRAFIPLDVVDALFDHILTSVFEKADQIHTHYPDLPFIYVSAPPPNGDEAHIRTYPNAFAEKLNLPFSPPELRLALYEVQCRAYQRQAARHGARFLPAPSAACTPEGFLDLAFAANDPTHGNAAYGRLVLDQISSLLEQAA